MLPENAIRVGEIESFALPTDSPPSPLDQEQRIPGEILLKDGTVLNNIHSIIVATGYHCSYPFLKSYHRDSVPVDQADDIALVTDGTQMHNLHKDIFYIPDPTLAFIGVPYYTATFTLFEFQAMALAAVFAGRAKLPSFEDMRREYRNRLSNKGYGRNFHSLRDQEVEYVNTLLDWVNKDGALIGADPIEGHTVEWHVADTERRKRIQEILAMRERESKQRAVSSW